METVLRAWEDRAIVLRNTVNAGFAAGCNQGARAASAPVVVFLNSDTEVRRGWIEPLIESASEPGAGMVGARLLHPDGRIQHAGMALSDGAQPLHLHPLVPGDHPAVTRTRELQIVTAACCAIDRALFAEHRGFDTSYTNGYEDVDLCLRLVRDGRRNIYRGDSVVVHHESMSPGRSDLESENALLFRSRWQGWHSDFAELLAEDGIDDAGADCRWEGPLFDASPEAAFGRAAVHALVAEGRVPYVVEPDRGPLAEGAGALCDDVLLAALNRRRIGVPAADTFRHLTGGRALGPAPNWGPVIAVVGPGARGARRHRERRADPRRGRARAPCGRRRRRARHGHRRRRSAPPRPRAGAPRRPRPRDGPRGAGLVRPPGRPQRLRRRRARPAAGRRGRRRAAARLHGRPRRRRPRAAAPPPARAGLRARHRRLARPAGAPQRHPRLGADGGRPRTAGDRGDLLRDPGAARRLGRGVQLGARGVGAELVQPAHLRRCGRRSRAAARGALSGRHPPPAPRAARARPGGAGRIPVDLRVDMAQGLGRAAAGLGRGVRPRRAGAG